MEHYFKIYLKIDVFAKILLFLFLFSLFFPIRHVFFNSLAYKTGQYSDFTSFSLYLSDILVVLLAFLTIPRGKAFIKALSNIKLLIFWLAIIFVVTFDPHNPSKLYFLTKWLEFIVAYGTFVVLFQEKGLKDCFIKVFIGFASLQSTMALWQFLNQTFIGLNKLGEQLLSPYQVGFAKIIANGITYVRGYGTFPHPNLLSAFLVASSLMIIYALSLSATKKEKIIYAGLLFINLVGLTVTFSRAAMLAVIIGAGIYLIGMMLKKRLPVHIRSTTIIFFVCVISIIFLFKPFLLTRATISDSASLERIFYAKVGITIIKNNPIIGVGLGESIPLMQKYSPIHLEPWQIQPVHNYFLLAATELGIIGSLILIWIFLSHLIKLFKQPLTSYVLLLASIFVALLLLMQFDHYFYTLQQTQLLLWVIIGITSAQIKNSRDESRPKT